MRITFGIVPLFHVTAAYRIAIATIRSEDHVDMFGSSTDEDNSHFFVQKK